MFALTAKPPTRVALEKVVEEMVVVARKMLDDLSIKDVKVVFSTTALPRDLWFAAMTNSHLPIMALRKEFPMLAVSAKYSGTGTHYAVLVDFDAVRKSAVLAV